LSTSPEHRRGRSTEGDADDVGDEGRDDAADSQVEDDASPLEPGDDDLADAWWAQ
jgi:hypothetical protein